MGSVYVCKAVTVKKKAASQKLGISQHGVQFHLKNMRQLDGGRAEADLKKKTLSAADEECLKVMSIRKGKKNPEWVQIAIYIGRRSGEAHSSISSHLSWFQPVVLSDHVKADGIVPSDFDLPCGKNLISNSFIYQNDSDLKHTASAVKKTHFH